ncbi:MAG: hypothetical protein FWF04_03280, partial [Clostridiales bacterium]|nr:hypothetical protein [Clostridiales bacterium]
SADAAAVLKGANALLDLGLGLDELSALGRSLGADVPFCLLGGLAKAEGVGDILTPLIAPPPLHILLVNPGFTVPTAQVFNHYRENGKPFANAIEEEKLCRQLSQALAHGDVAAINSFLANALSSSAQQLYPPIRLLEQRMRAVGLNPLLSGSGGTLFALLESEIALRQAQRELKDLAWLTGAITIN